MKWKIITPPSIEPMVYADVAAQARVDSNAEQTWIEQTAIPNARATAEAEAQMSLITQTLAATLYDECDAGFNRCTNNIRLPRGPVQSITSVIDGNTATVDPSQYQLRRYGLNDFLHLNSSQKFPLVITYVAGYGSTAAAIPADIRGIMLAHVTFLYENRSADVDPSALERVYRKYRSFAQ